MTATTSEKRSCLEYCRCLTSSKIWSSRSGRSSRSRVARTITTAGQRSTNRSRIAVGNILVVSTEGHAQDPLQRRVIPHTEHLERGGCVQPTARKHLPHGGLRFAAPTLHPTAGQTLG